MYIDSSKCIKCKKCVPFCPRNAIIEKDGKMTIDLDLCVECGVCKNYANCPADAIYNVHLEAPRAYRKAFSDPFGKHENTALKHMGRGTEEVKTNDVTGVVHSLDYVSFCVELGRPSVGSSFNDLQKISMTVAPYAIKFEPNNPITALMTDTKTGKLDDSVLNEEIMSAIVEFSCKLENVKPVLKALKEVSTKIDTVFSLCIMCRVDEETDTIPALEIVKELGLDVNRTSAKTNLGLGRPRYEDRIKEGK
jgi:ferredoxin